jgi:hypothetical protein
MYIDLVGLMLLFPFCGPPSMYGGRYDHASILPYALLVFGLELSISLINLASKTREPEP